MPTTTTHMRAIEQTAYGSAEVLRPATRERPEAGDGEVLIEVRAAGLDRGTWHLMYGTPYLIRPVYGFRRPKNPVPGLDVSGVVRAVGPGVSRFAVGDEVFGIAKGSFAEFAVAVEKKLAHKPESLTFDQAAVVAVSGLTAIQALCDQGNVEAGQRVLVIGASGGVGTYAVQLAAAFGAHVTGVCSPTKADLVRSIGADQVIDYTTQDFADGSATYDLILDIGGSSSISRLRRALTPTGTMVVVGGEGGNWFGGIDRSIRAQLLSPFIKQRLRMFVSTGTHVDLEKLADLVDAGRLTAVVDQSFPLEEAPEAMRRLDAGQVRGKVALHISG